jgi:hypothetical protein
MTILPIFALLISSILKYLRRRDLISSNAQEEYNEIMDHVKIASSSIPTLKRTHSLITFPGERRIKN